MAKRTVHDCDLCGARSAATTETCLTVDTFTDAAGASDTDQRHFDLCGACVTTLLKGFLAKLSFQEGRLLVERITKQSFRDHQGRIRPVGLLNEYERSVSPGRPTRGGEE